MDVINVITLESGIITKITSFVIERDRQQDEQAWRSEIEFQKAAREITTEPLDMPLEEFIEEHGDCFENGDKEVRLIWSHQVSTID